MQEGLKEGCDNFLRRLGVELSCCENNPLPRHVTVLDADSTYLFWFVIHFFLFFFPFVFCSFIAAGGDMGRSEEWLI